jgi:hypothetical protein
MIRSALGVLACASALLQASPALAAAEYKIVTASERGTYIQIGRDLANFVAPAADITLETLPSAGSAENVRRLRWCSRTSTRPSSTKPGKATPRRRGW